MLSESDYANIHNYVGLCFDWIARRDLVLTVETDMRAWADMMRAAPKMVAVNPTFDPDQSYLTPSNSFWLRVTHNGRSIACSANRYFETDDFIGLMRSLRLWYDLRPVLLPPLAILLPPSSPRISGGMGHSGGLWVHPDYRGIGLSRLLPRLIRVLSLRHFDEDWHSTLVTESLLGSTVPRGAYGYTRFELVIDGHFPVTGQAERIHFGWMDRAEMITQLQVDRDWLAAEPGHQAVGAAAVAGKRQ